MNKILFKVFGAMSKDSDSYIYECFDIDTADQFIHKRQDKFITQELSYCRGWPTVREQLRLCLHRRCVEYLATGNFYLLA